AAFVCALSAAWAGTAVSALVNPFLPWFAGTDIAIALVSAFVILRAVDIFRARPLRPVPFGACVLLCGVATGVVAAIVSAPVVAYLFGGVTGSGSAFVVAFFLKTGQQLVNAVVLSGLAADPPDKVVQVLLAALL